jgi:hypothetical protein
VQKALSLVAGNWFGANSSLQPEPTRNKARTRVQETLNGVKSTVPPGNWPVAPVDWEWSAAAQLRVVEGLTLDEDLQRECASTAPPDRCATALKSANQWLTLSNLMQRGLALYSKEYTDAVKAYADRRVKMWHAYRDEALPQYPWEYLLNSAVMKSTDRRPRVNGNPVGYEQIPTSQIIFLHPGVSLEWRDAKGETQDDNVKPALYVELFGINRWDYDEAGNMRGGKGISLMVSYANRNGKQSTGYGVMFHSRLTKQFTLGITRADGEMVYLVNVDLAEYFKTYLPHWKDVQSKIDGGR